MKSMKKVVAVLLVAVMTMSMGILAFAETTVTFHFKNAKNWSTVGAWVYEGIAWTTNVTPADKCAAVNGEKQLWPGAKCEDEGNGWVKITATFADTSKGAALLFNNWVADNKINETTTQEDLNALAASGVVCDSTLKEQTGNIMIGVQKAGFVAFDKTEYWVEWDGASTGMMAQEGGMLLTEAPASYAAPAGEETTAAAGEETTVAAAGEATTAAAGEATTAAAGEATTAAAGTTTTTGEKAPQTGDAVAMTVVLFGLVAAVAFVVSKKKANA